MTFSGSFTKLLLYGKRAFLSPLALPHGVLWDRSLVLCPLIFEDFRVYSQTLLSKTLFTQTRCFLSISCSPTLIIVDSQNFPMVFEHHTWVLLKSWSRKPGGPTHNGAFTGVGLFPADKLIGGNEPESQWTPQRCQKNEYSVRLVTNSRTWRSLGRSLSYFFMENVLSFPP